MPGLFDDLVPDKASSLTFADLIPGAKPKRSMVDDVTGFMANVNRGLGIGDELAAGARTAGNVLTGKTPITDIPADFNRSMATQRGEEDSFSAAHPLVAAGARGTGNALTMAAPVGPGAAAFVNGGRAINALRGATVAGLTGAGYAAVDRGTPAERLRAASGAATDPVVLGLGAGAGALATAARPKAASVAAPTLDELTTQKNAAYSAVDQSGIRYTPEAFSGLTQDMANAMDQEGFNAGLHPKAAAMMERIGQSDRGMGGVAPTLTQLDQLRQQIGRDVASSSDAGERRMGTIMRDRIDDFIASARPDQMTGGDPSAAATLATARDLNTRVQKLRSLDDLDAAAEDRASASGSGSNGDNATRQNMIRFQRNTTNLTPAEQAATRLAIRGGRTQNALRAVGRMSPEGGTVPALGSIATGAASHGVAPAAGFIARRVADAMTQRNVQALRELIASGGESAQEVARQLASDPAADDLRQQLANDLAAQAGVQGASRHAVEAYFPDHPERGVATSSR